MIKAVLHGLRDENLSFLGLTYEALFLSKLTPAKLARCKLPSR
jgi:hypothetical protein